MKDKLIEIFRPGKHISSDGSQIHFSEDDVKRIAKNYNPRVHEAPVVIGHPKTNSPAFGWVKGLFYDTIKKALFAIPAQLNHNFVEAVRVGAYKKVSASLYAPDSPNNPNPGEYSLRHIGFLGAEPPAIKGLSAVSFSEKDKTVDFELKFSETDLAYNDKTISQVLRKIKNLLISKFSAEEADAAIPEYEIESLSNNASEVIAEDKVNEVASSIEDVIDSSGDDKIDKVIEEVADVKAENEVLETQKEDLEDALTEEKKKRLEAEQKLLILEDEKKSEENTEFCEARIKEGRLLPSKKSEVVKFMNSLSPNTLNFGEGRNTDQLSFFKKLMLTQPRLVNFNEVSSGKYEAVDLSDPHVLASKAREYQDAQTAKGKSISFSEAVTTVKNS